MEIRIAGRYAWRYGWAALAVCAVFMLLALSYEAVQDARSALMILLQNWALAAITFYLLIFLVLLIFRFALLILYSFLDHLESLYKERDKSAVLYRGQIRKPLINVAELMT